MVMGCMRLLTIVMECMRQLTMHGNAVYVAVNYSRSWSLCMRLLTIVMECNYEVVKYSWSWSV